MRVKICGLNTPETLEAAVEAGARYVGLVFFPASPRAVTPEVAVDLALRVPPGVAKVALLVDPSDEALDRLLDRVPLDMIQLHGRESPERVREIRARVGLPVMKAVGLAAPSDLARVDAYARAADQILVDAKAPKNADLPGGNGLAFDWRLLEGRAWTGPWMLAGGLTPATLGEAVRRTGARQIDVSSGVERAPGDKDPALIRAFLQAARELGPLPA